MTNANITAPSDFAYESPSEVDERIAVQTGLLDYPADPTREYDPMLDAPEWFLLNPMQES